MAKAGLLFVGTDDGLVLFSNPNNIGRWLRIGQPFRGHAVRAVWPLVDNPLVVFAAVTEAGVQRSDDGGQSWREVVSLDAAAIAGHHRAASMLYLLGMLGEVYRSDDGGERWELCPAAGRPTSGMADGVAVAYEDARRIYQGLHDSVWTSADAGETWSRYGEEAPVGVTGLAASPAQPGLLYALAEGGLYACAAADAGWERIVAAPRAAGAPAVLAGKIPALLLAAAAGGIARSEDGGATWATAGGEGGVDGQIGVIVTATYHIDTAFAGGVDGRLIASTDRGRTWEIVKRDLPPIRSIAAARLA